jgi:hypothetical protein
MTHRCRQAFRATPERLAPERWAVLRADELNIPVNIRMTLGDALECLSMSIGTEGTAFKPPAPFMVCR